MKYKLLTTVDAKLIGRVATSLRTYVYGKTTISTSASDVRYIKYENGKENE